MAAFWHCGLTVSDIARSTAFYRDVVGMAQGQSLASASPALATLVGIPGARLDSVFLTAGSFTLQLVAYEAGAGEAVTPGHNRPGSPHLSFFVPDIEACRAAIAARGDVPITSPIVINDRRTIRSFYVADPDGVPVEFVERLAD
ncbi:MAG TPA: VOC family protein [Stellaceae bacterium]|nr:VOC family protein [Stellaceae bacterium]